MWGEITPSVQCRGLNTLSGATEQSEKFLSPVLNVDLFSVSTTNREPLEGSGV